MEGGRSLTHFLICSRVWRGLAFVGVEAGHGGFVSLECVQDAQGGILQFSLKFRGEKFFYAIV